MDADGKGNCNGRFDKTTRKGVDLLSAFRVLNWGKSDRFTWYKYTC